MTELQIDSDVETIQDGPLVDEISESVFGEDDDIVTASSLDAKPWQPTDDRPRVSAAIEELLTRQGEISLELSQAELDLETKTQERKLASGLVDSLHDALASNARRIRNLRVADEPDPDKYPLLDKPSDDKAAINEAFPASVTDSNAAWQSYTDETSVAMLGLSPKLNEVLTEAGVLTIATLIAKSNAASDARAFIKSIEGMTEARYTKITEALSEQYAKFVAEYNAEANHPPDTDDTGESIEEDEGDA